MASDWSSLAPYNPFLGPGPLAFLAAHPPDANQQALWPGVRNLPPSITAALSPQDQVTARMAEFVARNEKGMTDTGVQQPDGSGAPAGPNATPSPEGAVNTGVSQAIAANMAQGAKEGGLQFGLNALGVNPTVSLANGGLNTSMTSGVPGRSLSLSDVLGAIAGKSQPFGMLPNAFAGAALRGLQGLPTRSGDFSGFGFGMGTRGASQDYSGRDQSLSDALRSGEIQVPFNAEENAPDPGTPAPSSPTTSESDATAGMSGIGGIGTSSGVSSEGAGAAAAGVAGATGVGGVGDSGGPGDGGPGGPGGDGGAYRRGGPVTKGRPKSKKDDVPARLQYGEFVIPRAAVHHLSKTAPQLLRYVARVSGRYA